MTTPDTTEAVERAIENAEWIEEDGILSQRFRYQDAEPLEIAIVAIKADREELARQGYEIVKVESSGD